MNKKIIQPQNIDILRNEELIFISGVFDILHLGHISFFRESKIKAGKSAKLVIALHDDQSVKSKKGNNRPFMTQEDRAEILSELEVVDYVIPWAGWENIVTLVKDLEPKYLAVTEKSFDHSKEGQWHGESWDDIAKEINAEIIKVPLLKDYASSKLIHLIE